MRIDLTSIASDKFQNGDKSTIKIYPTTSSPFHLTTGISLVLTELTKKNTFHSYKGNYKESLTTHHCNPLTLDISFAGKHY